MLRFPIPQFESWFPDLREKMRLDGKMRFMLLLIFFNAMLIAIILLSVYNQEVQQRIQVVETQIRRQIERLATIEAVQLRIVYITETPTPTGAAVARATPTHTATVAQPTDTPTYTPSPDPSSTPTPSRTPTRTPTRTPSRVPTRTPAPTLSSPTPSPSPTKAPPTLTPTETPRPTVTPVPATSTPSPTPGPATVTLTALPGEIFADGTSTAVIRARVLTAAGNPVTDGTRVIFATDRGAFGSTATTVMATVGGIAEATLTSSTTAGVATISAIADTATATISLTFAPLPAYALALSASPTDLIADGSATSILEAIVTDRFGNAVADTTTVTFGTSLGVVNPTSLRTAGGRAVAELSSSAAGTASITASAGGASNTTTVYLAPWIRISQAASRSPAPAGSVLTYTIIIENRSTGGDGALLDTLDDTIPAGFLYAPGSTASPAFGNEPSITGQNLTWTAIPWPYNLGAGNTVVTTFRFGAEAMPGTYSANATIRGRNFGPVSTGTTAPVTLRGPILSSMEPHSGYNDAPVAATIAGADFAPGVTARLGPWTLVVTWVNESTLNATIPEGIADGTYELTVMSPGGASATLPNAYVALNRPLLNATLERGYLGTYGAEPVTSASSGDDDQIQVLFLEVPDTTVGPLYVRLFDPDCGGTLDIQNGGAWDTPFTYTIYGGSGAYTDPDAQSAHPTTGASSGTALATAVFTQNAETDGNWYTLPLAVAAGEHRSGKRIFKLTVVGGPEPPFTPGIRYADLNLYHVVLSTSPTTNTIPAGSRIFAFSWTFLVPGATYQEPPRTFPYIEEGTHTLRQHNWDYDSTGAAGITITTPIRTIIAPSAAVSPDNEERSSDHAASDSERNTTWTVSCWAEPTWVPGDNLVTFWTTDQDGRALAIFSQSTYAPPP